VVYLHVGGGVENNAVHKDAELTASLANLASGIESLFVAPCRPLEFVEFGEIFVVNQREFILCERNLFHGIFLYFLTWVSF
jgi:hypothetical protein